MDGCVTAPVAWTSGPSVLASRGPWGRRRRGTHGPARSRERPWVCRSVHRPAKTASRRNHRSHAERALWSSLTRKMRLSVTSPVQNAPLGHVAVASSAQSAPFRESDTPRVRLSVSRRLQSGAHVHAVATRFAEASTHTNPRRATFVHVFTVKALVLVDAKRIDRTGHFCPTTAALERRMLNSV